MFVGRKSTTVFDRLRPDIRIKVDQREQTQRRQHLQKAENLTLALKTKYTPSFLKRCSTLASSCFCRRSTIVRRADRRENLSPSCFEVHTQPRTLWSNKTNNVFGEHSSWKWRFSRTILCSQTQLTTALPRRETPVALKKPIRKLKAAFARVPTPQSKVVAPAIPPNAVKPPDSAPPPPPPPARPLSTLVTRKPLRFDNEFSKLGSSNNA